MLKCGPVCVAALVSGKCSSRCGEESEFFFFFFFSRGRRRRCPGQLMSRFQRCSS